MKVTLRTLAKSLLVQAGIFTLARDAVQIVRARLKLVHESDYDRFKSSDRRLRVADVGANTGQSLIALRKKFPNSTIACYEPNPACYPMLNRVKNIVGGDVEIHQFGVGAVQSQIEFFTPVVNDSIELLQEGSFDRSQFTSEATVKRIGTGHKLKSRMIEVRTIDSMNADLDILKMDVQGLEWDVLQGANETIRRCRPIIFMERDDRNRERISQRLANFGYQVWPGDLNDIYWHPASSHCDLLEIDPSRIE